ncbi:peptidoglycan-binding protein, partial [Campylobacter upsaliensis]|nr:peptidoglycan-binding protein [Campylobacter upsaliensis]
TTTSSTNLATVQKNLQTLGYYAVPATTGNPSVTAKEAIQHFQMDYLLPVTGNADEATTTAINHAIVKKH